MGAGMAVIALGSALRVGQGKKRHVFTPPAQTQLQNVVLLLAVWEDSSRTYYL